MSFTVIKIGNYPENEPEVYATIREISKYIEQQPLDSMGHPLPFEIKIDFRHMHYCVVGNGNKYRLSDVDLWIEISSGSMETLPMHQPIYRNFIEQFE